MKFNKNINREWLISNGIGGYASSTIIGINTRKYHGLMVAPLTPPARRHLILSKVDEAVKIGKKEYGLYSNMCSDFISEGYKHQTSFEFDVVPKFTYKVNNVIIEKEISFVHKKNIVVINYKFKNEGLITYLDETKKKPIKNIEEIILTLAPVINFRDFHRNETSESFNIQQTELEGKTKVTFQDYKQYPIYFRCSEAKMERHENDVFKNMYYQEEENRGFFAYENHLVPRSL
jgi:predicted glycogen debranching enzyme